MFFAICDKDSDSYLHTPLSDHKISDHANKNIQSYNKKGVFQLLI